MPREMPKQTRQSSLKQQRREKAARKARRNRMYMILGGVVVLAIIAVVVLINANKPPEVVGEFVTVPTQTWPAADGKALGPADAKVVVKEYADFQCPVCKIYNDDIQGQIIDEYVSTGKIRYEYHHFIIIDGNVGGTESRRSAEASECANDQGRFWDYHEMLFANQGREGGGAFTDSRLKAFAGALGLDTQKFNSCFDGKRFASSVNSDDARARAIGLNATPSLLVNDQLVSNPRDINQVKSAIDAALATAQ